MDLGQKYVLSLRERASLETPEIWFMFAAVFITISWIFNSFIGLPDPVSLSELMFLISRMVLFIAFGVLVFLLAMLSLYLDERMRLSEDDVLSSNFNFTRLFTPVARAILLLFALQLIVSTNPLTVLGLIGIFP